MSLTGFAISKLVVRGHGKLDASLEFRPGLNVVAGASNTGKTYAWQVIDFMLGASTPPKNILAARGYTHAMIAIHPHAGGVLTLERALAGGDALAYTEASENPGGDTPPVQLGARHAGMSRDTISGRLLELSGLFGKAIRTNVEGAKRSLSFRDVAWLTSVDEERIIAERSPVFSGQYVAKTGEQSTFGLFITGVDDAAIVSQEAPKQRKLRIQAEMQTLQGLLDDREARLVSYEVNAEQIPAQRASLAMEISEASDLQATQQAELNRAAERRDQAWSRLQSVASHRLFLAEQMKRLELLRQHYFSDAARLESSLEAGELFERLPEGTCPVCGQTAESGEGHRETDQRLREFQDACKAELLKIAALSRDLDASLEQMRTEDGGLAAEQESLQRVLDEENATIRDLLNVRVRSANTRLSELIQRQSRLSEAAFTSNEVIDLRTRFSMAEQRLSLRRPRPKFAKKVEAASATDFCKVVAETLRAWKFPFAGSVAWSDERSDIVIDGENRGSMGKGYRAITHAAFTISLMRYCRARRIPHPGFVVLDTPLNPYRGPDKSATEGMNTEVQAAFYADLAADRSGDQVIVFENTEPPANLRGAVQYEHFSGAVGSGRSGFIPHFTGTDTTAAPTNSESC